MHSKHLTGSALRMIMFFHHTKGQIGSNLLCNAARKTQLLSHGCMRSRRPYCR